MAKANYVPTPLCAQNTGTHDNSSTTPSRSFFARLFAVLAEHVPGTDARLCDEAVCTDITVARSAS